MKDKRIVISVDIGGTNSRFALIGDSFQIIKSLTHPTILYKKDEFVTSIVESIREISSNSDNVVAISLGIPGPIGNNGHVIDLPNIHIQDIPLGEILRKEFGLPVFIRNDAEMACFAEAMLGHGKNYQRVFFITISTGLGGALVVNHSLKDSPLEIGHTPYTFQGQDKYYEYFASGNGLSNLAKMYGLEIQYSHQFFKLVENKNALALKVYEAWLQIMSDFLTFINERYHPDIYTFTGGVFNSKEVFWNDLTRRHQDLNLQVCYFDQNAGLIGAACYAFTSLDN
jgi:glucokinase